MQVRKFEASTMKEALQMVKLELGPDAIILSAKDNKKSFGLAGRGSIEITAAISEKSLMKKQYVEKHLPPSAKERFQTQTAKSQKAYIEDTVARREVRNSQRINPRLDPRVGQGAVSQRPLTTQRYIDIDDEESASRNVNGRRVDDLLSELSVTRPQFTEDQEAPKTYSRPTSYTPSAAQVNQDEIHTLRRELDMLRELLAQANRNQSQNQSNGNYRQPMTQHPGAEYGLPFELSQIFEKLHTAGIDTKYIVEILEKANEELTPLEKKKSALVDAWVARFILSHTSVTGAWSKNSATAQMHLFVGPGGVGKSTTLVKLASHLVVQEQKKVAIVTTDTFKVGGLEQLRIYSKILNLPFEVIHSHEEYSQLLRKFSDCDYILVDLPGLSLKEMSEVDQIRNLIPQREIPKQTHLVLSCTAKENDAYETCSRYQVTHFDDILVTKLDESQSHGFLYNIQRKTQKSLYAFGIGQKVPEDIELATRERVLDLIYKITKR